MEERLRAGMVAVIGSVLACTALAWSLSAEAASTPRRLASDARIRQVMFDPNQVYEVTGVYGYATTVEFAPGEKIENTVLGDTIGWEVKKFRNHLVLKPVEENARTNLTVTTSRHVYYFRLSSSTKVGSATYAIHFVYPGQSSLGGDGGPVVEDGFQQPRVVNKNYKVSGDEKGFGLQSVFDDGQFTYFLVVGDKSKPAIYTVEADGTEALPNIRREGPYLAVERLANGFTLRDGDRVLCIRRTTSVAVDDRATWGSGH
ncbi:TrbG/VirB9 family P-type conjugative transfer protein [Burkholderia stagnalis]